MPLYWQAGFCSGYGLGQAYEESGAKKMKIKIKELRLARGWTQRQLAEASDVSQSAISAIETNDENPSLTTLELIAKGLGVSIWDLLEEE